MNTREKKSILVAGGCGFVGSNFIHMVIKDSPNITVINFDALTKNANLENHTKVMDSPRYHFIRGDICDKTKLDALLEEYRVEAILNFAVDRPPEQLEGNPQSCCQTNIIGTATLLQHAVKHHVKKFIQVSSVDLYGSIEKGQKATEETPANPNSAFSISKAAADEFVELYHKKYGLHTVISRSSNNYGPYQFPQKLIPLMFHTARKSQALPVYGDGLFIRDWLHVTDHCKALWRLYEDGKSGEIYNIGAGNEISNLQIVKSVLSYLGKPKSLMKSVKNHPPCARRYSINCDKLRMQLNWQPSIAFDEGLVKTLGWYYNNQDWLAKIDSGEYRNLYGEMHGYR